MIKKFINIGSLFRLMVFSFCFVWLSCAVKLPSRQGETKPDLTVPSEAPSTPAPAVKPLTGDVDYVSRESADQKDQRLAWWREARFGMFIHWGLYAVPAGEWKGTTNHAEWILTTARIPVAEYEKFGPQFNPVNFNAAEWVRLAKEAGMKYIVITSKHHDGFSLWDSAVSDYDVMDVTPFQRDILRELTDECNKQGIRMCFYHSIMDWHHPDYLPRRGWETRSAEGADLNRYVKYMKEQVRELVLNYHPGVLWFDGEWEQTWDHARGLDLYNFVRALQPDIIINNRVDKGRAGMAGIHDATEFAGDFGTPEQEIPATGLPGYDWETCMTMNNHWGWNKNDKNFKSTEDLIRKLIDIASKGGNFLLNIGPKADGTFPQESIERLAGIGRWMEVNGESIYGTTASLFSDLSWGRSTTKDNKIYLQIFDWPTDSKLPVPGLITPVKRAYLLGPPQKNLTVEYDQDSIILPLPAVPPDPIATVAVLEFDTTPEVVKDPQIIGDDKFYPSTLIQLAGNLDNAQLRFTLDGSNPTPASNLYSHPFILDKTTTITCRIFREGKALSGIVGKTFTKTTLRPAEMNLNLKPGLNYQYYQGQWDQMPDFNNLTPTADGVVSNFDISLRTQPEDIAYVFTGYLLAPADGVYKLYLNSDDGSKLYVGDELIVNNDGLHVAQEVAGAIALERGPHPIRIEFFQRTGGIAFEVSWSVAKVEKQIIPAGVLYHKE